MIRYHLYTLTENRLSRMILDVAVGIAAHPVQYNTIPTQIPFNPSFTKSPALVILFDGRATRFSTFLSPQSLHVAWDGHEEQSGLGLG